MQLLKTIVSAAIMAGIIHFGYEFLLYETASNALATFASLFVGMFFYIIVLILIGGIMESDIERIPMIGAPSIRFFKKNWCFKKINGEIIKMKKFLLAYNPVSGDANV